MNSTPKNKKKSDHLEHKKKKLVCLLFVLIVVCYLLISLPDHNSVLKYKNEK